MIETVPRGHKIARYTGPEGALRVGRVLLQPGSLYLLPTDTVEQRESLVAVSNTKANRAECTAIEHHVVWVDPRVRAQLVTD